MDTKSISSTVKTLSASRKEVAVEISAGETAREFGLTLERFASRVKLAGFRQGKVPRDLVQKRFAQEIERALVDDLAPLALQAAFREHGLEPVGIPIVRDIEFSEGRALRFKAEIDVWPEFELPDYRKIKVARKPVVVGDDEVAGYLEQLRLRSAEYVPVQGRGAAEGDYVAVEVQGTDVRTGKKFPLEKSVLLAGPSEENPLSSRVIGLSEGGVADFSLAFPADHHDKKLAGKEIAFRLKVLAVKEKKLPVLDDDLAKTLGDFENLESLRRKVHEDLLRSRDKAARGEAAQEVLAKLSEQIPDDLPRTLVEQEAQELLRKFIESPASQGLSAGGREAVEDIKARLRRQAERNLKHHLVLKEVAARESLAVGEDEIEEEIRSLAQANRVSAAGLRSHLQEEGRLEGLRESLLFRKAVDFLADLAIIRG